MYKTAICKCQFIKFIDRGFCTLLHLAITLVLSQDNLGPESLVSRFGYLHCLEDAAALVDKYGNL